MYVTYILPLKPGEINNKTQASLNERMYMLARNITKLVTAPSKPIGSQDASNAPGMPSEDYLMAKLFSPLQSLSSSRSLGE